MSINKNHAAILFDNISVVVERFHASVKLHPKAIFLGYADITVTTLVGGQDIGNSLRLRGIQCKVLGENFRLDMPGDKVERDGKTDYIPYFFPLSGELRAVLEAKVSMDARIIAAVETAAQMAAGGTDTASAEAEGNPFRA